MCLIITQPAGHTLSRAHLLDIFSRNGDGFGIMRADGGKLRTWRIVTTNADEMLALYYAHAAGRACVLHWRMATHGAIDTDNAHPFRLTRDIAVVHNGMMDCGTPTAGKSDTWHMARHVLAPMARDNPNALFSADVAHVLGGLIGTNNKLVFLHADGRVAVVNEASGVHHAGRWYSNTYAWDAPASLRAHTPRRSSWLFDDDAWGDAPAPTPSCGTPGAWHVDEEPAELLRQCALDDLEERIARGDRDDVAQWCDDYPDAACDVLCATYDVTRDDARLYLHTARASVADWLMESGT